MTARKNAPRHDMYRLIHKGLREGGMLLAQRNAFRQWIPSALVLASRLIAENRPIAPSQRSAIMRAPQPNRTPA